MSFKIVKILKKSDAKTDAEGEIIPGESMPEHGDPKEPEELGESSKPGEELYNIPEDLTDLQLEHLPELMVMINRESKAAIERNGVQTMDIRDWYLSLAEETGEIADAIREDNKDEVTIELVQAAVIALKMAESIMYGSESQEHEESDSSYSADAVPTSIMGDPVKVIESKTGKNNGMNSMLCKGEKGFYVVLHDNGTGKNGAVRKFSLDDEKAARVHFGAMKVSDVTSSIEIDEWMAGEMNEKTRDMILKWLKSYNGDIEKTAQWIVKSVKLSGGIKAAREAIHEALKKTGDEFKSQAQQRYLFAREPEVAKEFAKHTSKKQFEKLPEYAKKSDEDCKAINAVWNEADELPQEDEGREAKLAIIKDKFEKLINGAYLSEEQKQIALREFDKNYLAGA